MQLDNVVVEKINIYVCILFHDVLHDNFFCKEPEMRTSRLAAAGFK